MKKVLVLGGTGMLGSMVADYLSRSSTLQVTATAQNADGVRQWSAVLPEARWTEFDAERFLQGEQSDVLDGHDWIINAIGIIKPYIKDDDSTQVQRALRINGLFPHALATAASSGNAKVLQIATDCVYSGRKGAYSEEDAHDALDAYGKTKSLGEVIAPGFYNIRCSIIGPEAKSFRSLLEWFLAQPAGATVTGFTDHQWNGVTTLHYAKVCEAIIGADYALPGKMHLVPRGAEAKASMLDTFAAAYGRDINVQHKASGAVIDRTLSTTQPELSAALWALAGYEEPPTVPQMIEEMAKFDYRAAQLRQPEASVAQ